MKFPIAPEKIWALLKARSLKYADIYCNTSMNKNRIKFVMNRNQKVSENELNELCGILGCDANDILETSFLISQSLPAFINEMVGNLYSIRKEDIQPYYDNVMYNFRRGMDFKNIMGQANRLFNLFVSEDDIYDKSIISKAMNLIVNEFPKDNCIASQLTWYTHLDSNNIFKVAERWQGEYKHPQLLIVFQYSLILFDVIFLAESLASVSQFNMERISDKSDQYYALTKKSDQMVKTLYEKLVIKGDFLDQNTPIEAYGIDDKLIEGIVLMLAACNKCDKHLESPQRSSQYVNRPALDVILNTLFDIFSVSGIELVELTPLELMFSRFGVGLKMIREITGLFKTKKITVSNYNKGLTDGINTGAALACFFNSQKPQE